MLLEQHVAAGVHRVEDAYTNWYILEDGGRLTIVDTGFPASWKSLQQALVRLGRSARDIDAIVLTHAHFDHMGFADRARRELGVPVWAHVDEQHLVAHPWDYDHEHSRLRQAISHPSFLKVFAAMGLAGALWVKGTSEASTYTAGQVLDVPGHPRAVFTPGHTYGHCSLHLADRGALLAGDAIVTFDPYTTGTGPQIVSGAATADSAQALASLTALEACAADVVATGHGPVWKGDIREAVARAREAGPS
jgi:glyoxylase-like metal-dependent hydrolase (beta-lactamase superfamily II)